IVPELPYVHPLSFFQSIVFSEGRGKKRIVIPAHIAHILLILALLISVIVSYLYILVLRSGWPLKESVPHRGFPKALRRFRINSRWRKSVCQGRRAFVLTRFQKTQKFFPNSGMDAVIERTVYFLQPRFLFTD